MSARLAETRDTTWMSDNGRVRIERGSVWVNGKNKTARFLTIKFGLGAGYQVDPPNGRRGATLTIGTHVKVKTADWGQYRRRRLVYGRLTRNGNHPRSFFPGWW